MYPDNADPDPPVPGRRRGVSKYAWRAPCRVAGASAGRALAGDGLQGRRRDPGLARRDGAVGGPRRVVPDPLGDTPLIVEVMSTA